MSSKVRSFEGWFSMAGCSWLLCICTEFNVFCMGRTLFGFESGLFFVSFV